MYRTDIVPSGLRPQFIKELVGENGEDPCVQAMFGESRSSRSKQCPCPLSSSTLDHGFAIGDKVEAHSLQSEGLNGVCGRVQGSHGERVAVSFPDPIGYKVLKASNLKGSSGESHE